MSRLDDEIHEQEERERRARAESCPWVITDMTDLIKMAQAGTIEKPVPHICHILDADDDRGLFYRRKVNGIAGDSGAGKSWVALHAAHGEVLRGHHVIWVDYEDTAETLALRMNDLGFEEEHGPLMHHVAAAGSIRQATAVLDQMFADWDVSLMVFDSAGEALAGEGLNPNADEEVAKWFQTVPRRYAKKGACVLSLDHMAKNAAGLWPIGSQRKRSAIDGIQYVVETVKPFSREVDGRIRLICAKDRGGWYAISDVVAEVAFYHHDAGLKMQVWKGMPTDDDPHHRPKPTVMMQEVSKHVEAHPGCTFNSISNGVTGKRTTIAYAVELLVEEGYLELGDGPRKSVTHTMAKAYRVAHFDTDDGPDTGNGTWTIDFGD